MLNEVILVGRLTNEPSLFESSNGVKVANFTLACNYGNDKAEFIQCKAWNKSAEYLSKYAIKGSLVLLKGMIKNESYKKDNQTFTKTYINTNNVNILSTPLHKKQVNDEQITDINFVDSYNIENEE